MSTTPAPTPEEKPAPARPRGNDLLWWILGLLVAAVIVLGLGGLLVARYMVRQIEVHPATGRVEIQTPIGQVKVSKDEKVDPSLPVYPGATLIEPVATVEIGGADDEPLAVHAAKYRTPDPLEKVDAWYSEHLGKEFTREGPGVAERKRKVFGITVRSDQVAFISEKDDALRVVALERKFGSTEIALARIGERSAQ